MIIKDNNTNKPLLDAELPKVFSISATSQIVSYPDNQKIVIQMKALRNSCEIVYKSGDDYFYEKKKQSFFGNIPNHQAGEQNNSGAYYALPVSLKEELDNVASNLLNRKTEADKYYNLPDECASRLSNEYSEVLNDFAYSTNTLASFQQVPVGIDIRNYLLDGAMGIYQNENKIVCVALCRMGYEYDVLPRAGINENITGEPFGRASDNMYANAQMCEWSVPFITWMVSDNKEDIGVFMNFVCSLKESDELKNEARKLKQQVMQYQLQKAQIETMNNQAMWNMAFANQQQQFAAMDRLTASIHQDLDNFHNNLNAQMQSNDQRFNLGQSSMGESMDDRIQRMRHESIMGVETYERNDGSTVEYSGYADRVFENNLDSTSHFGTHHYYDDYIPEGWHEMKKK